MTRILTVVALLGLVALAACGGSSDSPDSAPASRAAPPQRPDAQKVPADLRHLVALAEEWGIGEEAAAFMYMQLAVEEMRTSRP